MLFGIIQRMHVHAGTIMSPTVCKLLLTDPPGWTPQSSLPDSGD